MCRGIIKGGRGSAKSVGTLNAMTLFMEKEVLLLTMKEIKQKLLYVQGRVKSDMNLYGYADIATTDTLQEIITKLENIEAATKEEE